MIKYLRVTMPDKSQWDVPVSYIASNRAMWYATNKPEEYSTYEKAAEATWELFNSDDYEIEDWAENNMNWDDVVRQAVQVTKGEIDYDDGWINGEKQVLEKEV